MPSRPDPAPLPPSPTRASRAVRAALAAAALAFAGLSAAEQIGLRREQRELAAWLEQSGVAVPAGLYREPDAQRVRLRAARAMLAAEVDPARAAGDAAADPRAGAGRMAETARLAARVLADRPASWDAAMLLGAGTYLSWVQARDTHLFTAAARWEEPLLASLRLAPSRREPARFLATAYLEVWPALSPARREAARTLLAETFRNPDDLAMLIGRWMAAAGDRAEVFSLIPDEPEAWDRVQNALEGRRDWPAWSAARARWDAALLGRLRRDLAEAEARLAVGDRTGARRLYLSVLARSRPDQRYFPLFERALERCPPGPVDFTTGRGIAPLLSWALDRCVFGDCSLRPAALRRLTLFARDEDPLAEAMTALAEGDLNKAELLERRSGSLWSEASAPYLVLKTRLLAERGLTEEARGALARIHRSWEEHPLYWQARRELARAEEDAGVLALANSRLAGLERSAWPATAWDWRRGTARLEVLTAGETSRLELALDEIPAGGAVVELWLDGRSLGPFSVARTAATAPAAPGVLGLELRLGRGGHLLEMRDLAGGRVVPGAVRVL
jgi:hypothetical protein